MRFNAILLGSLTCVNALPTFDNLTATETEVWAEETINATIPLKQDAMATEDVAEASETVTEEESVATEAVILKRQEIISIYGVATEVETVTEEESAATETVIVKRQEIIATEDVAEATETMTEEESAATETVIVKRQEIIATEDVAEATETMTEEESAATETVIVKRQEIIATEDVAEATETMTEEESAATEVVIVKRQEIIATEDVAEATEVETMTEEESIATEAVIVKRQDVVETEDLAAATEVVPDVVEPEATEVASEPEATGASIPEYTVPPLIVVTNGAVFDITTTTTVYVPIETDIMANKFGIKQEEVTAEVAEPTIAEEEAPEATEVVDEAEPDVTSAPIPQYTVPPLIVVTNGAVFDITTTTTVYVPIETDIMANKFGIKQEEVTAEVAEPTIAEEEAPEATEVVDEAEPDVTSAPIPEYTVPPLIVVTNGAVFDITTTTTVYVPIETDIMANKFGIKQYEMTESACEETITITSYTADATPF
jgi:hypothetical protein